MATTKNNDDDRNFVTLRSYNGPLGREEKVLWCPKDGAVKIEVFRNGIKTKTIVEERKPGEEEE